MGGTSSGVTLYLPQKSQWAAEQIGPQWGGKLTRRSTGVRFVNLPHFTDIRSGKWVIIPKSPYLRRLKKLFKKFKQCGKYSHDIPTRTHTWKLCQLDFLNSWNLTHSSSGMLPRFYLLLMRPYHLFMGGIGKPFFCPSSPYSKQKWKIGTVGTLLCVSGLHFQIITFFRGSKMICKR